MKHIALDLVRVTEAAAIAASRFIGSGDKIGADEAATIAMRDRLSKLDDCLEVKIGEWEKDKSVGLVVGERNKPDTPPLFDLAVDPIEGTRPTVTSGPEAISTVGVANIGCLWSTKEFYTMKLAYGPAIASRVRLRLQDPLEKIVERAAFALDKKISNLMVCILDRPRHKKYIECLRMMGTRIKLIQDCDVSGSIAACFTDRGIDLLYGVGGAPECVLSACAIKCLRGDLQAMVTDDNCNPLDGRVLELEDLVKGDCCYTATGITDGSLLKGVRFTSQGAVTNSVSMRSQSGTVRWLTTHHGN